MTLSTVYTLTLYVQESDAIVLYVYTYPMLCASFSLGGCARRWRVLSQFLVVSFRVRLLCIILSKFAVSVERIKCGTWPYFRQTFHVARLFFLIYII